MSTQGEAKLAAMGDEEFLAFLNKKARETKKELYKQTSLQTNDYFTSAELFKQMDAVKGNLSGNSDSASAQVAKNAKADLDQQT